MDPRSQNLLELKKIKYDDGSETVHYPALYKGVPNEFKNFAEEELGETPEKISRGIKYLKMFLEDKGLAQTEEKHLLAVLRNCKHDLKKSKGKLEKFLRAKQLITEKLAEMDDEKIDRIVRQMILYVLPYRDKHGRPIYLTRPPLKMDHFSVNEVFVCSFAIILYALEFPMTSLVGFTYIADSKAPSVSEHLQIIKGFKSWLWTWFDLPVALRQIHCTNENFVSRWFLKIARPIIPTKIYKRITLYGDNMENLKKTFHPDLLPEEFGGNSGPMNCKHYREEVLDFMRKLKEEHLAKKAAKS